VTKADRQRLEAFEMWIWRRMERISWIDKVSNADVLTRVKEDKCMLNTAWQRKHKWLGQLLRHEILLRDIIEGRMKGKAIRGRKRLDMLSDFKTQHDTWRSRELQKIRVCTLCAVQRDEGNRRSAVYNNRKNRRRRRILLEHKKNRFCP